MTRLVPNPPRHVSEDSAMRLWTSRVSTDTFLEVLRKQGANKIESIRLLRYVSGLTLGEAKNQVHLSETWKDRRANDEAFHEVAWQALELLQEESKAAVA